MLHFRRIFSTQRHVCEIWADSGGLGNASRTSSWCFADEQTSLGLLSIFATSQSNHATRQQPPTATHTSIQSYRIQILVKFNLTRLQLCYALLKRIFRKSPALNLIHVPKCTAAHTHTNGYIPYIPLPRLFVLHTYL